MTIALLNTEILTPVTPIVRVSDRRDFIPQGALSCGNAIDQNGRSCPCRQRYRQDLSSPFASSFCRGQIHQWESSQVSTIGDTHSIDHFACVWFDSLPPCNLYLSISPCWADLIGFFRNSPSGLNQTICRNAAKSMLSLLSLHFVNVG